MDRRTFIQTGAGLALATGATKIAQAAPVANAFQNGASPFGLCLNTSTIRPAILEVKIKAAAEAGYDAIELWINDLEEHEKSGGNLKDLGKSIIDQGLYVINVIGLWSAVPPTDELYEQGMPATRERMRMSADVGSRHVAALPDSKDAHFDIARGAKKYKELLRMGINDYNIRPAFEFVGFFKSVFRLGQAAAIALDADEPEASIIPDTFHLYRGGSGFSGIGHLNPNFIANFHWNDVPDTPEREQLGDEHRIYPGDGILPLTDTLEQLAEIGYKKNISLELFNRALWEQDPMEVAKMGRDKMLANIAAAGLA